MPLKTGNTDRSNTVTDKQLVAHIIDGTLFEEQNNLPGFFQAVDVDLSSLLALLASRTVFFQKAEIRVKTSELNVCD